MGACVIWNNPSLSPTNFKIIIHISREFFDLGDKVSCIPGWAQTRYTAEAILEHLILLSPFADCWDDSMHHHTGPTENIHITLTGNCHLTTRKDLAFQH